MNTYPKIINCDGNIGLLTNEEFGISLSGLPNASYGIWTLKGENITREYLANTYGEVKNGEHADFIVKLAESAGFELHSDGVSMSSIKSFVIYGDEKLIGIYTMKVGHLSTDESYKEITIPLPPKEPKLPEVNSGTPMPEVKESKKASMNDIQVNVKNNTDSVVQVTKSDDESNIFICVSDLPKEPKPKEWPQVGDEVVWGVGGVVGEVVFIHELDALIKTENNKFLIPLSKLSKPQSALEEELSRLIYGLGGANTDYCEHIAKAIINGEIKGLSYKPE